MSEKISGKEAIMEALQTTSHGMLVPELLSKKLPDLANREVPLRAMLPAQRVTSSTYDFNQLTGYGAAVAYAEGDSLSEADSTYVRKQIAIKMIGILGGVSGLLQEGSQEYIDAMGQEIQNKTFAVAQEEERQLFLGDVGGDPKEFNGLAVEITTNVVDATLTALAEDHFFEAEQKIKEQGGKPNMICMSPKQERQLKKLLNSNKVYNDRVEVAGGLKVLSYDNMPVMVSTFCPDDTVFVLDTRNIWRLVLKDVTFEELGLTAVDKRQFRVKQYVALCVKAESHNAKIINLA